MNQSYSSRPKYGLLCSPFVIVLSTTERFQFQPAEETINKIIEGSGSFPRKLTFKAQWMIATASGCCLRPLGFVLNEQLEPLIFI